MDSANPEGKPLIDQRLLDQLDRAKKIIPEHESEVIYQIAFCHLCKKRGLVFVCYKNYRIGNCT
jgi:hypothetical protein